MSTNFIWKSQPIFISSTFTDMMAERDALRDFVFKELDERLQERRIRLEPIDLRWGVETSTEEEKENKELMVLKVCLNEIDRCKPFFVGIIGDRYGWVPPEKRMKDAETEKGFESKLKNKSVTALEIEYGVFEDKEQLKRSFFFFREPLNYKDMPETERANYSDEFNPELKTIDAKKRLDDFKKLIVEKVGKDRVFIYKAEWDGNSVTGLDDFKKQVTKQLWKQLDAQTKELEDTRPKTWQDEERKYLNGFIEDRTVTFSGREDIINYLRQFALSEPGYDNQGKCITGESGYGKSALFSKLHKELSKENVILLSHAAGISLRSNSLENMLTLWIEELAAGLNLDVSEELKTNTRFQDLTKLFSQLLSQTAIIKRVVVLVDALNQFERTEHARYVNWLPELIPSNAKFIFTAIAGEETENLLKRKGISVEELKPVGKEEAKDIIMILCSRYHKKLNEDAVNILLEKKNREGKPSLSNPLWLTMAVDEFLLMDEDDFSRMKELEGDAEQKLKQLLIISAKEMPGNIAGMYNYVYNRCSIFGEKFANSILCFLGVSRYGLRESDLERLITKYTSTHWDNLNFASFRRYLRNHLVRKGELGLWDFRHIQARESLKRNLLANETGVETLHKQLSEHLEQLTSEDPLHLTEILWHLFKCDNKNRAASVYGNFSWSNHKTRAYSITVRDLFDESEHNILWFSSLITSSVIGDNIKRMIIRNVNHCLYDCITNHINLSGQLMLFHEILKGATNLFVQFNNFMIDRKDMSCIYNRLGNIYLKLGDSPNSLINFLKSINTNVTILEIQKDDEIYIKILIDSFINTGDIHLTRLEVNKSEYHYSKAMDITQYLTNRVEIVIEQTKILIKIAHLHMKVVDILVNEERRQFSIRFEEAMKSSKDDPKRLDFMDELVKRVRNKYNEYRVNHFFRDINNLFNEITSHLTGLIENPCDKIHALHNLALLESAIGDYYNKLEESQTSIEHYNRSKLLYEEMAKNKLDSIQIKQNCAELYHKIAFIFRESTEAIEFYLKAISILEELLLKFPDSVENKYLLSVCYTDLSQKYHFLYQYQERKELLKKAKKQIDELCELDNTSMKYKLHQDKVQSRQNSLETLLSMSGSV